MVEKIAAPAESLREVTEVAATSVEHYKKQGMLREARQLENALDDVMGTLAEHPNHSGEFIGVNARSLEKLTAASGWTGYHEGLQNMLKHYGIWG